MIQIKFPDASIRSYEIGTTVLDVAKNISEGLARNVLSAKFNNQVVETLSPLTEDGQIELWYSSPPLRKKLADKWFDSCTPQQADPRC